MKSLSLYQERNTIIHKIDPISKLFYIVAAIAIPVIIPARTAALACMAFSILLLLAGRVFRKVIPIISFSMIVLLSIIVIQGLFYPGNKNPLFAVGSIVFYKEGLLYALQICIRVVNILCAFAILVLTTKPSDLIESLVRRGLSPRIGYVLSSVLQIIPQMASTMDTITDAQRSRGMEAEGKLMVRLKAFFPLIGPVVMNSLINTRERAMALEVRGFNSKARKTFLNEEFKASYNLYIKVFLVLSVILAILWRIIG
ncbi:MAG: energy-coupling factor transporter transmembrane component T family protein [Caulobacteraceae bacterium]